MLKRFILLLFILIPLKLFAQNSTLTGNIFDNENRSTSLEGASIKNITTNGFVMSDKDGHFAIAAKVGHLVSFSSVGYQTDTVYLTNLFPKNVYLRVAVNNLNTVDVTSVKLSPFLILKDPNAAPARQVDYSKERGGLRLNLGYGKYRKEQAKIQALEEYDRYQQEISKYFNEDYVKGLLKFKGNDIKNFLSLYRPTVQQVKGVNPFNYDYYIAQAYQAWLNLPLDQRKLPALPKLKTNN